MKTIRKLRYYCDYCKKSGGSPYHMKRHEEHCTMNPNRHCRVCDAASLRDGLEEHIKTLEVNEYGDVIHTSEDKLTELMDNAEWCPACVLSVLRRNELFFSTFDYKEQMARHWDEVNSEKRSMIAYDHDY